MPPRVGPYTRECPEALIDHYKNRIHDCAVPRTTGASGRETVVEFRRKFYPIRDLRRIFAIDDVKNILMHDCEYCQAHLTGNMPAHPTQYEIKRILETDAALSLFALLVSLRYPLLIGTFLISFGVGFVPFPQYLTTHDLLDRYFRHLPQRSREQLVSTFQDQKWQFSVPIFDDASFQRYEVGTILPYLDEEPVGSGGYGKVSKVYVHPYYCRVPTSEFSRSPYGTIVFARKEIIDEDVIEFIKEKTNLEKIAGLKDDHLVQITKTYQLGDKYNILFPCAKTNLYKYLREREWQAPQTVRINQNLMWPQVLGITVALGKIINFPDPENPANVVFGYHLDLKPENVLVDNSGPGQRDVFKITDFGQTRFVDEAFAGTSRIRGGGGTDIYAPPEYLENEQDRAYDVWSLGIIVMEVLAYAVRGIEGLQNPENGLDAAKHTREGNFAHSRFYTASGADAVVKPSIVAWTEDLLQDPAIQDKDSQDFVHALLELIWKMLEPRMKKRIAIDRVVKEMATIFEMKASDDDESTAEGLKQKDEQVLIDLKQVDYYAQGAHGRQSACVPLQILENVRHRLRIYVDTPLVPVSIQRQEVMLALPSLHSKSAENGPFAVSFSSLRNDYSVSLQDCSFVVHNETEARTLQMALLGQRITKRYRVVEITSTKYHPAFENSVSNLKNLVHWSQGEKRKEESPKALTPMWVELWMENIHTGGNIPSDTSTLEFSQNRRAKRQVSQEAQVPRGRVVIYCEDTIIIIPFAKECRLEKQSDMKHMRSRDITFEPMDRRQCKYFTSAFITATRCQYPSIPMYQPALYELEKKNQVLMDSLNLKFYRPEDAYLFYKIYRNDKAIWLDEIKGKPAPHQSMIPPA